MVDTAVRDAWRIKADQLSFDNPRWQPALDAVVKTAAAEMGVSGKVRASLYNLLLYGEGGKFKKVKLAGLVCNLSLPTRATSPKFWRKQIAQVRNKSKEYLRLRSKVSTGSTT